MASNNEQISFNVTKSIWRLNRSTNGWQKEVNLVAWNGKKPKLDVREWNTDKTKMRRGVTFNKDEVIELKRCLNSIDIEWLYDIHNDTTAVQTEPGPVGAGLIGSQVFPSEPVEEDVPVPPDAEEKLLKGSASNEDVEKTEKICDNKETTL